MPYDITSDTSVREAYVVTQFGFSYVIGPDGRYVMAETLNPKPVSYRFPEQAQAAADRINGKGAGR